MTQSTKFTKLNIIIKKYAIEEPIVVYNCQKLSAFCHGLRNPKIYISSTVLQEMNVEEIASIILHEQYHIKKNDNKKFFVVFMLQSVFFPFPFLKDLVRRYRLEKEIAADQSAIQQLGKNEPLITAFKKMLTFTNRNQTHTLAFTPSFADFETLEARIKVLTNQAPPVLRLLGMKRVMISVCSLTILFAFSLVPVHAADHQPRDYHSAIVCLSEESCSMTCEDSLREVSSENNYSSQPYSPAK